MRPSRYSDDQIRQAIARVADGTSLAGMCRTMEVTPTTFYRWRRKYGDGGAAGPNETRALRDENRRLKQLVADLYLEQQVLQASITKHTQADRRARG
ncbi:MAG TPA: transposase [Gemmatimonadaceae bacterium]|jgi:putative transposase